MENNLTPKIRFRGFNEPWVNSELNNISSINPKTDVPDTFEYVDLESVVGTSLLGHRTENKESAPSRAQRLASKGDIFYQTVRPYQKNNFLFDMEDKNFVFSTGYAQIRSEMYSHFLFNVLQRDTFIKEVLNNCTGTSFPAINANALGKIRVSYPYNTTEQKKIGDTLTSLESTLNCKHQELGKLENVKNACMERFFPHEGETVPQLRFKGFTDNWVTFKLGKIGKTFSSLSGKTKEDFGHGDARFVTYMNVFTNPIANVKEVEPIEIDNSQTEVRYGDIFFTTSSETPNEVGMSSIWLGKKRNVYLNSFCFGYRLNINYNPLFIAYLFRSPLFRERITLLAQGISRFNISKNKAMEIEILMPDSISEQEKIGNYFRHLDELIAAKRQEIEKLQNIKQSLLDKMFV